MQPPADVIVLCTLHQLHPQVSGYGFADLARLIELLGPDVLAVELTSDDLAARREQPVKREYQETVYPLLDRHRYPAIPLEPDEPRYSELVRSMRTSVEELASRDPSRDELFDAYTESLYSKRLFPRWSSPAAVNDAVTDALFAAKHDLQDLVYGTEYARAWAAWNEHFAERILAAAREHVGGRTVVLVGAEHGYWLRPRLRAEAGLSVADTEAVLRTF